MHNSFHPSSNQDHSDRLSRRLKGLAEIILVTILGFSPLLFIPTPFLPIGSGKFLILLAGIAFALFFYTLSMLREGRLVFRMPSVAIAITIVALVTAASAFLSGDLKDSFTGAGFESYTVAFVGLLALIVLASGIIASSKKSIIRLYALLIVSAVVVSAFHILRFIFGADFLSLGIFTSTNASPLGGWNGLAIFYGLIILLSQTALLQLPLTGAGRAIVGFVSVLALVMLGLINFTTVWYVLFAVSIVILIYSLVKNRWLSAVEKNEHEEIDPMAAIVTATIVASVSIVFIVGGARLGESLAKPLGLSFVEVRPSLLSTIELAQATLGENIFFGAGPNRFPDVWRMHKDQTINQTIFWNTQFDTGYSYLTTSVIGTGSIGLLAWIFFLGALLWSGFRFLFLSPQNDQFWYFTGLSSLIASIYLWGMAILYVPPTPVLVLAAITTGVFLLAYAQTLSRAKWELSIVRHRANGLLLIALAIAVVSGSASALFVTSKQALALYEFNRTLGTVQEGDTLAKVEEGIGNAFSLNRDDAFARQLAYYEWIQMRVLMNKQSPTDEDKQTFQDSAAKAVQAARTAVQLDPTDPNNQLVLGQIYAVLSAVEVEGAYDSATAAYAMAGNLDPKNPVIKLLQAELALQKKDVAMARSKAEEAVSMRPAYTEALYFLAQLDVSEGKVDQAINRTIGMVQIEPQNAARRYQLGVLLASEKRIDEAIVALEQAVRLDSQYANARYFLALGYAEKGRTEDAIKELEFVKTLNESNAVVDDLIERLKKGEKISLTGDNTVSERDPESGNVSAEDLEGGLVTTPNPVSSNSSEETTENQ